MEHAHTDIQGWYNSYIGKSCKGKKCPHLGQVMIEHGDRYVCPLHNLVGSKATETIIPYEVVL